MYNTSVLRICQALVPIFLKHIQYVVEVPLNQLLLSWIEMPFLVRSFGNGYCIKVCAIFQLHNSTAQLFNAYLIFRHSNKKPCRI